MSGKVYFCVPQIVPPELEAKARELAIAENAGNAKGWPHVPHAGDGSTLAPHNGELLAIPDGKKWAEGKTLRVRFTAGNWHLNQKVFNHASVWAQYANVHFEFVEEGWAEIRIAYDPDGTSWSKLGTDALLVDQDKPTINFGWLTDESSEEELSQTVAHEFGHALGAVHEHQSPQSPIQWNKPVVTAHFKAKGWDTPRIKRNIFDTADRGSTNFTDFDSSSIMIYHIPKEWTLNGWHTERNMQLSDLDKSFIRTVYPGKYIQRRTSSISNTQDEAEKGEATIETLKGADNDVRPAEEVKEDITNLTAAVGTINSTSDLNSFSTEDQYWNGTSSSKYIEFQDVYLQNPLIAIGLTKFDFDARHNPRIRTYGENINKASFNIKIDTWATTNLYAAAVMWFKCAPDDPDFRVGEHTANGTIHQRFDFDKKFATTPDVVVFIKGFDMDTDYGIRLRAYPTSIDSSGFTLNIETWSKSVLYQATVSWVAHTKHMPGVVSGSAIPDSDWTNPQMAYSKEVAFLKQDVFQNDPTTAIVGFNFFDIRSPATNIRLQAYQTDLRRGGLTMHLYSWSDTTLYGAGASYLILQ